MDGLAPQILADVAVIPELHIGISGTGKVGLSGEVDDLLAVDVPAFKAVGVGGPIDLHNELVPGVEGDGGP
jgi:hypothetical protein